MAVDVPSVSQRTFTYSIPSSSPVQPGDLVWVPFGSRTLQGVVFELASVSPVEETRDIQQRVDGGPFLWPHHLALARWMAEHYRVGLFLAASQMLPPGASNRLRTRIKRAANGPPKGPPLGERERRALSYVPNAVPIERSRVVRRLGRGGEAVVDRLVRRGLLEAMSTWTPPRVQPLYEELVVGEGGAAALLAAAEDQQAARAPRRAAALRWLAWHPEGASRARLASRFGSGVMRRITEMRLVRVERRRVERDPLRGRVFQQQFPHEPTAAQAGAIQAIVRTLRDEDADRPERRPGRFLLFGVTGSGKTEVYLQAAAACLARRSSVLVLVSEIALTPQTLARFEARFPGQVALLHSGLTAGERHDQWWRVKRGDYSIVLGSRSAVFAPLESLGLVVIDEEHEWTYKQTEQAPRFDARQAAERLCALTGAAFVAGSATPDVVSFRRAQRGAFGLLRLPSRIAGGEEAAGPGHAAAQIVDMRQELRDGRTGLLSRRLEQAMRETVDGGDRVILFLNRRGTASFVQCRSCGTVRQCRRCDNSLTYHRGEPPGTPGRLVCHYCSYNVRAGRACTVCGGRQVRRVGAGTQAVVDVVRRTFPGVGVLRWDRDAAKSAADHEAILEEFLEGQARVLVGTQMVAKGLDIPAVTLVGVVSADTGLAVPDFRAAERAFQVLVQVAGRAGRGSRRGRVIIQTLQPEHYAIVAAADQDYEAFYEIEIGVRAEHADPPFSRLIRLMYADPRAEESRLEAVKLAARLRRERTMSGETGIEVIGPTPAYPPRLRGRTRWHVVLKGAEPARLLDKVALPRGWVVDVDPVSLA